MAQLQQVYRVEADARTKKLTLKQLHDQRQCLSKPVLARIYEFIDTLEGRLGDDGYLRRAVTYLQNQKQALLEFLDDPRIPLTNTHVERLIKVVALVRKNSLLAGSFEGAQRLARYMTIVGNCKLLSINPYHYLTDVLTRCGRGWPITRLAELMPSVWRPETPPMTMPALTDQVFRY